MWFSSRSIMVRGSKTPVSETEISYRLANSSVCRWERSERVLARLSWRRSAVNSRAFSMAAPNTLAKASRASISVGCHWRVCWSSSSAKKPHQLCPLKMGTISTASVCIISRRNSASAAGKSAALPTTASPLDSFFSHASMPHSSKVVFGQRGWLICKAGVVRTFHW